MGKYAYAEIESFKEPLMVFSGDKAADTPFRTDGGDAKTILMSRPDFNVQILELPPVPENQIPDLLRYKIKSLYPGDPARTVFDYQAMTFRGRKYAVLFITRKEIRESYEHLGARHTFILPFQLMKKSILAAAADEACFLFWNRHWVDLFSISGGALAAANVIKRSASVKSDCARLGKVLRHKDAAPEFTVFCEKGEEDLIREQLGRMYPESAFKTIDLEDLFLNRSGRVEALFTKRKPFIVPPLPRRLAAYAVLAGVIGLSVFFRISDHLSAYQAKLIEMNRTLMEKNKGLSLKLKEIKNMEKEFLSLQAKKPADLYLLLSELAGMFPPDTEIQSIIIKNSAFQIEGTGGSPLLIEEKLKKNAFFKGIEVSEMTPISGSGRQKFRMKGEFLNAKTE